MKNYVLGLLAHVDAGKTTVCEGLLYENGIISSLGRVDKKTSFLDFLELERKRGITIFSKQAVIATKDASYTLIDTPGHRDLVCETLRAIPIMDAGVLIIDASSEISEDAKRLFFALREANVPVFIFLNKTDIFYGKKNEFINTLSETLEAHVVDFSGTPDEVNEQIALSSDEILESFLEGKPIEPSVLGEQIRLHKCIPVFWGSALKQDGIKEFWGFLKETLPLVTRKTVNGDHQIFRISYDKEIRLTHLKVGEFPLKVKDNLWSEKIEEIRRYSGKSFESITEASPGMVVAIRGAKSALPNSDRGWEFNPKPYIMELPTGLDIKKTYDKLVRFFEQFIECHMYLDIPTNRIKLEIMGEIQKQVLLALIEEQLGLNVDFYEEIEIPIDYDEVLFEDYLEESKDYEYDKDPDGSHSSRVSKAAKDPYSLGLEEIDSIIARAGGSNKRSEPLDRRSRWNRYSKRELEELTGISYSETPRKATAKTGAQGEEFLLVDGYNIIFAWEELSSLAEENIDAARDVLIEILSEYAHVTGKNTILVFDAYKVSGGTGSISRVGGIDIVFTKEAQTADAYIEKTSHEIAKTNRVTVATGDRLEQVIVRGEGAMVLSANDLLMEVARVKGIIREEMERSNSRPIKSSIAELNNLENIDDLQIKPNK